MALFGDDYSVKGDRQVNYVKMGERRLFSNPDADEARSFFRDKSRKMVSKVTTAKDAVAKLVEDGDYLGVGGFGTNRVAIAVLHEIVRQKKKNLGFAGHTSTHDMQVLIGGKCINRCDAAYVVGLEARGLSKTSRKAFESGEVEATEWTNAALTWRYKAAAMGLSFLPARNMMGTDTIKYSSTVLMPCPFTGKQFVALPALYPDVALIHVHRSDIYGNSHIEGISTADIDLARAAKKLIISTERIVLNEEIRQKPHQTAIPYYLVDAVVEAPFGAYPTNMPYEYFTDEAHLKAWLEAEKDEETFEAFFKKQIYDVEDHWGYIALNGGARRLSELKQEELLTNKHTEDKGK